MELPPSIQKMLRGAWDAHVHFAPDSVPRSQDALTLQRDAAEVGMEGIVLKSHTAPTAITAFTLNAAFSEGPKFYGSLTLNPSVGGLNPAAVQAALASGATVIWFPTYSSALHYKLHGRSPVYPHDPRFPDGLTVWDADQRLLPEVEEILEQIASYDAVLATGHLSAPEIFALLESAMARGVKRFVVTHASEVTPGMTYAEQRKAISLGAWVEHSLLAATECQPGHISLEAFAKHLSEVGPERLLLTTDFGQVPNGPSVEGFAKHLGQLLDLGIPPDNLRKMIADNPRAIHVNRNPFK